MRVLLCGLAVALMMAAGAYGASGNSATVNISSGGLNTLELGVDFNPGDTIVVDIDIPTATAGMVTAQLQLDADKPGLTYESCQANKYTVPFPPYIIYAIDNYDGMAGWDTNPFGQAAWIGWLQDTTPADGFPDLDGNNDLIALPGGPLPTPWFGTGAAVGTVAAPSHLGFIEVTIPAVEALDYPVTISALDGDFRIGDPEYDRMDITEIVPLVLIPEPTSALLLLIGALPLLRRRR